ncbi:MAG: CehA/McbA family metallohydrolase [Verrucomicrobiia bacterium]
MKFHWILRILTLTFFTVAQAADIVNFSAKILDADTGMPIGCRIHLVDNEGNYQIPEGHSVSFYLRHFGETLSDEELDLQNRDMTWALLEDGTFSVNLEARDGYILHIVRGLEYERKPIAINLKNKEGAVSETYTLKRVIHMKEQGWMSGDSHVHNLTPKGAAWQQRIVDVNYVHLMFMGDVYNQVKDHVHGRESAVSKDGWFVDVSQEQRDANMGHLSTFMMKDHVHPLKRATGTGPEVEAPNEPLNWEVADYVHDQGGFVFHAHYLIWPGYGSAWSSALGKLDGIEWLSPDSWSLQTNTRQKIDVNGFGKINSAELWYHMLNCGIRLPLSGGTDKMGRTWIVGGKNRFYAKVNDWSWEGMMDGLKKGRTFVTNGPLLLVTANGQEIGAELKSDAASMDVKLNIKMTSEKPVDVVELIRNGKVEKTWSVSPNGKSFESSIDLTFETSGWCAVRVKSKEPYWDNWGRRKSLTAAHTSPFYITLKNTLPADSNSARYMIGRMNETIEWHGSDAIWSSKEYEARALQSLKDAKAYYEEALARAKIK